MKIIICFVLTEEKKTGEEGVCAEAGTGTEATGTFGSVAAAERPSTRCDFELQSAVGSARN